MQKCKCFSLGEGEERLHDRRDQRQRSRARSTSSPTRFKTFWVLNVICIYMCESFDWWWSSLITRMTWATTTWTASASTTLGTSTQATLVFSRRKEESRLSSATSSPPWSSWYNKELEATLASTQERLANAEEEVKEVRLVSNNKQTTTNTNDWEIDKGKLITNSDGGRSSRK